MALRYRLTRDGREALAVAAPLAESTRLPMPDREARSRFVAALLALRCGPGEELELFGEAVAALDVRRRERLHARIAVLSPAVGLLSNLNVWENIALPAAYHGTSPIDRVARSAAGALEALGAQPRLLGRLPDELDVFERKLVAFVRLLVAEPDIAVFDALEEGLDAEQRARAAGFASEYRSRRPEGALVFVDLEESRP